MDSLLMQLGEHGVAFTVGAVFIYYLYKQNERWQAKSDAKDLWHLNFMEGNTKATLELTNTFKAVGETLVSLVARVAELERLLKETK